MNELKLNFAKLIAECKFYDVSAYKIQEQTDDNYNPMSLRV